MRQAVTAATALLLTGGAPAQILPPAAKPPSTWTQYVTGALPPPAMQYLFGSGEGAAAGVQAYHTLASYAVDRARRRPRTSVILLDGADPAAPRFRPCATRRLAVVLDVDETVLLNLGAEEQDARHPGWEFDRARWRRWELSGAGHAAPVPGAAEAFAALRRAGIVIVLNSNRAADTAEGTVAALQAAGLGRFTPGEDLFLRTDSDGKDARRAQIAGRYCVIAMAGDQLGDFSDALDTGSVTQRRALAAAGPIAELWGRGWFVLPNPVYGHALRGGYADLFPPATAWKDEENR